MRLTLSPHKLALQAMLLLAIVGPASAQVQSTWTEARKITSPNAQAGDQGGTELGGLFSGLSRRAGFALSDDGDVMVVGAPGEHQGGFRRGAAYIFRRSVPLGFALEATLSGTLDDGRFGGSVAISGDGEVVYVAKGGVYRRGPSGWSRTLAMPGYDHTCDLNRDGAWMACIPLGVFGAGSDLQVVNVLAGGPTSGGGTFFLGTGLESVSISDDGTVAVVGAPQTDQIGGSSPGAVFALEMVAGSWLTTKLISSDRGFYDSFGYAAVVSGDGRTIVASALNKIVGPNKTGQLYSFEKSGIAWPGGTMTETATIPPPPTPSFAQLGSHLTASAGASIVGVSVEGGSTVWALDRSANAWTPLTPSDRCQSDWFAPTRTVVSSDGRTLIGGAANHCYQAGYGLPGGAVWEFQKRDVPTITWNGPPSLPLGVPLSAAHLAAVAGVAGTFDYQPPAGTVMPYGRQSITVTFTPSDQRRYQPIHRSFPLDITLPPSPVLNDAYSVTNGQLALTWTAPQGLATAPSAYIIEGGVYPGQLLGSLSTSGSITAIAFPLPSGAYYIRLRSRVGAVESAPSNEIRVFVNIPAPPAPPYNLLGSANGSTLSLAWTNGRSGGPTSSAVLHVGGALTTTLPVEPTQRFDFAGVPPGTYSFAVSAANPSGASGPSNSVTLTFPGVCSGPPLAVSNFAVRQEAAGLALSWDLPTSGPAPTSYFVDVTGSFVGRFATTERGIAGNVPAGIYNLRVVAASACGEGVATAWQTVSVP